MVLFEFIKALRKAKLSKIQIEVILLQLAGITNDEIAKQHNIKSKSVKDVKFRARKKLNHEKYFSTYFFFIQTVYPNLSNDILAYLRGDLHEPAEDTQILCRGRKNDY